MIAQSTAPAVDSLSDRAKAELRAAISSGSIFFWRGFPDIPPLPGGPEALDDFDVCRYICTFADVEISCPGLPDDHRRNYNPAELCSQRARSSRDIMSIAVSCHGSAIEHASPILRDDKGLVMEAVRNYPDALEFASPRLRSDYQVVFTAVTAWGPSVEFASEDSKSDKSIALAAVRSNGMALHYLTIMKSDKEVVMAAVTQTPWAMPHARIDWRREGDFLEALIQVVPKDLREGVLRRSGFSCNPAG